ncbi:GIY-YIG nuclease family protein [Halobellus marinus]|uniref:GIY-YIG nuclease family protein n=1 Tax=Halobellus TaxID=1073986 RepID=UPI0028A8621C|nr:GIY-YIG nuclease family protein [Halobellus sp. DFY28]
MGKLKSDRWTGGLNQAERIIYVGVTVNLQRRLLEHVDAIDSDGAEFTQVFPPLRVLDVSWYRSYRRAHRAEKRVADAISERFSTDYVYQS